MITMAFYTVSFTFNSIPKAVLYFTSTAKCVQKAENVVDAKVLTYEYNKDEDKQ